jgi:hypothetical protein
MSIPARGATLLRVLVPFGGLVALDVVPAQTTWVVTTTDGIQPAIQAASPGDVLVLTNGPGFLDHLAFHLDKGLTIVGNDALIGQPPASAQFPNPPGQITFAIPPGQVAHVRNLRATYGYSPFGNLGLPVIVQSGSVRFEDCELACGRGVPTLRCQGDVVVEGGTITGIGNIGPTAGVQVDGGRLTLRDVTVQGGETGCPPPACASLFAAMPAIDALAGEVHVERASLRGGSNPFSTWSADGAPAVIVHGARVRVSDSALVGGNSPNGAGGEALRHFGGPGVELQQTTLTGGTPGGGGSTGTAPSLAPLVRLTRSAPWTRGAVSTLTVTGPAGAIHGLLLAPDTAATALPAIADEPLYTLGGAAVVAGLLDASGAASYTITVPNTAALEHVAVWCQAVAGTGLPLRASTIAGGVVR